MATSKKRAVASAMGSEALLAPPKNLPILGTYEGECADANITNNNGLDITKEVWEEVFNSDTFQEGIKNGWYIGFLGHPKEPDCMDFKDACIVMTDGYIDDNGKVQGKFNLIDTPVGHVVKTFQDAGVTFGISVRGAGDIVQNSVTPGTFDFRGFDLVAFPAFPESIPKFTAIAASTKPEYKAICASLKTNLPKIESCEALDVLQTQFAPQSDEFAAIEDRKNELLDTEPCDDTSLEDVCCDEESIQDQRIRGLVNMYRNLLEKYKQLEEADKLLAQEREQAQELLRQSEITSSRKIRSMKRMSDEQIRRLEANNKNLSAKLKTVTASFTSKASQIEQLKDKNLKYNKKIEANTVMINDQRSKIRSLQNDLNETVDKVEASDRIASDFEATNRRLESKLSAVTKKLSAFQNAYANLYASAVGTTLDNVAITASTSVSDIQSMISNSTSVAPEYSLDAEEVDVPDVGEDCGDLITL